MGLIVVRLLSRNVFHAGQRLELPAPVKAQHVVEVCATPSSPSDACLSPLFSACQYRANFHLRVAAHFAEGLARISDSEIVYPSSKHGIDIGDDLLDGGRSSVADDLAYSCFGCQAGFLRRRHEDEVSVSPTFACTT